MSFLLKIWSTTNLFNCDDYAIAIYAGGRGRRMMPLTSSTNKVLLPYKGSSILSHAVKPFIEIGFRKFVVFVGYQKKKVCNSLLSIFPNDAEYHIVEHKGNFSNGLKRASELFSLNNFVTLHGNIILPKKEIEDFFSSHKVSSDFHLMISDRKYNDHVGHPYVVQKPNTRIICQLGQSPSGKCVLGLNIQSKKVIGILPNYPNCHVPETVIGKADLDVSLHEVKFTMKHFENESDL